MSDTPETGPLPGDAKNPANKLYTWEHIKAARREGIEAALAVVNAEPEPEGDMPAKLANTDKRILVLATVRATKRGIEGRIRALLTEGGR